MLPFLNKLIFYYCYVYSFILTLFLFTTRNVLFRLYNRSMRVPSDDLYPDLELHLINLNKNACFIQHVLMYSINLSCDEDL